MDSFDMENQPIDREESTPCSTSIVIHCKYCRTLLLTEKELTHYTKHCSNHPCSHFFSEEPPTWLSGTDSVQGKIHCPKCQHKLGQYSWIGLSCSCKQWVVPAFSVLKSRVDWS